MKHWARAKGSSWYMPEARSLYMMLRSVNATGCTVMELMMPRNSMARYKLPKMLPKSWAVDLHIQHTGLYQMTAVDYWQFAFRSVGDSLLSLQLFAFNVAALPDHACNAAGQADAVKPHRCKLHKMQRCQVSVVAHARSMVSTATAHSS